MQKKILGLGLLFWLVALTPLYATSSYLLTSQAAWKSYEISGFGGNSPKMSGASLSWGSGNPTSLNFLSSSQSISAEAVQMVSLGNLQITNGFCSNESGNFQYDIKGKLSLNLNLSLPEGSQALAFDLPVTYKNEPQDSSRTNKSDDVIIGNVAPLKFSLDGVDYALTIKGFATADGNYTKKFTIAEGTASTQPIYAELTRTGAPAVPIPPTAILMGSGLLGLLGLRRRA